MPYERFDDIFGNSLFCMLFIPLLLYKPDEEFETYWKVWKRYVNPWVFVENVLQLFCVFLSAFVLQRTSESQGIFIICIRFSSNFQNSVKHLVSTNFVSRVLSRWSNYLTNSLLTICTIKEIWHIKCLQQWMTFVSNMLFMAVFTVLVIFSLLVVVIFSLLVPGLNSKMFFFIYFWTAHSMFT